MNEQCSDKAREFFLSNYKEYYGAYMLKDFNKGRHLLIEGRTNIWFVFKKEHFHSFRYQFPKFIETHPEYDGDGDSINKRCLVQAVNYGCKYIIFAQKEDNYYYADPRKLLALCIDNDLERSQDKKNPVKVKGGDWRALQEETFSFPIKFLKVWKFNERLEDE